MENNTFLVFLFTISIGILFIGSGVTGLYSLDINQLEYCNNKEDCSSGEVCCAFKEGDYISRICARDCRSIKSLPLDIDYNKQTITGFVFDITGDDVKEVRGSADYLVYILIGIILILLALFYKKSPNISKKSKNKKR